MSLTSKAIISDKDIFKMASDTLIISKPVAILFRPDSQKVEELKAERGEEFYTIADDANWYVASAREFLEKQGLEVVDTNKGYVSFDLNSGETIVFNTDSLEPLWGLILFDGKKAPLVTYPVDAQYDYELYFKRQ